MNADDWRAFMAAHYELLARRLARHLGCPDLARDTLHDAWLRLADLDSFPSVDNPAAYVYRVACNIATDGLRASRPWQYAGDGEAELAAVADGAPGPDTIAEARSELAAVDRAMRELPPRYQAILVDLRVDGLPRQEVADRHGLSLRRMDTALRRALQHCAGPLGRGEALRPAATASARTRAARC